MKKIIASIKARPVNLILMVLVSCLYVLNNTFFKTHTRGAVQYFMICHFNYLICPLFFLAYSNLLLLTVNKELKRFVWIILFGLCSGLIWEFFAPVIKPTAITDLLDLCFYVLGTILYWVILRIFPGRRDVNDKA